MRFEHWWNNIDKDKKEVKSKKGKVTPKQAYVALRCPGG
jgi:hypothetical protein